MNAESTASEAINYFDEDIENKSDEVMILPDEAMYDSGASTSVVTRRELLKNFNALNIKKFKLADQSIVESEGTGTLTLEVNDELIEINDVSLIPHAALNIVSLGQLSELGYDAYISRSHLYLLNMNEKRCMVVAENLGGKNIYVGPIKGKLKVPRNILKIGFLYHLNIHNIPKCVASSEKTLYGQHLAGNHATLYALKEKIKNKEIDVKITPEEVEKIKLCPVCLATNAVQRPHNQTTQRETKRPLERVHCDTVGPIEIGDIKHYVTALTDDYSQYIEVIISQSKAIKETIVSLLELWNNYSPTNHITYFRSDNAAEMPSMSDLHKIGIRRDIIGAYSPELNGTAEVTNRIIFKGLRKCILNFPEQHELALTLFYYMVLYVITTINHTPRKKFKGLTPYQVFTGYHDFVFNFHQFGVDVVVKCSSKVEAKRLGVDLDKLTPPVVFGTFLGYSTDTTSFMIMISTEGYPVIVTPNVTFLPTFKVIDQYFKNKANEKFEPIKLDTEVLNKFLKKASEREDYVKFKSVHNVPHTYPNWEEFEIIHDEETIAEVEAEETEMSSSERGVDPRGVDPISEVRGDNVNLPNVNQNMNEELNSEFNERRGPC